MCWGGGGLRARTRETCACGHGSLVSSMSGSGLSSIPCHACVSALASILRPELRPCPVHARVGRDFCHYHLCNLRIRAFFLILRSHSISFTALTKYKIGLGRGRMEGLGYGSLFSLGTRRGAGCGGRWESLGTAPWEPWTRCYPLHGFVLVRVRSLRRGAGCGGREERRVCVGGGGGGK